METTLDANSTALVWGMQTAGPAVDTPVIIAENGVSKKPVPSLDGAPANLAVYSGGCAARKTEFLLGPVYSGCAEGPVFVSVFVEAAKLFVFVFE